MREAVVQIAKAVGVVFGGVTIEQILSRDTAQTFALARMVTVYVASQELGLSQPELGREMDRDKSSAASSLRRIAQLRDDGNARVIRAIAAGVAAAEAWKKSDAFAALAPSERADRSVVKARTRMPDWYEPTAVAWQ